MAQTTWTAKEGALVDERPNRLKFIIGGLVIAGIIIMLITNALRSDSQLYKTVDEYYAQQSRLMGRDFRVAGWVLDGSIQYTQIDAETSRLEFDIADRLDNPENVLHVVAMNEPKPELLQGHAQAVAIGSVDDNGVFYVNPGGLLLKCPTRYEELEPAR